MTQEMATVDNAQPVQDLLPVGQIVRRVNTIQKCMKEVMKENTHYGKVPGCGDRMVLLKPGAELLRTMFQFGVSFDVEVREMESGHREYIVTCHIYNPDGTMCCDGLGSASTKESKHRYRTGPVEFTGKPVPQEYWNDRNQSLIGGKGFVTKKNPATGRWEIARQGEKVENPDIADVYNTVLKVAKKRAFNDGILSATGASDMFTQDIIDEDALDPAPPVAQRPEHNGQNRISNQTVKGDQPAGGDYLEPLRALMRKAKDAGLIVADKADPTAGLVGWVRETYGCEVEELSNAQVHEVEEYVRKRIADVRAPEPSIEQAAPYEEPTLLDQDIEF